MSAFVPDKDNQLFQLASDFISASNRSIFLTGKAGTGKTTFLRHIRENCSKQMAVVAPTGVAAINAGGVTIHSFFQLPLSLYIPGHTVFTGDDTTISKHNLISRLRMNGEKRRLLQELDLLVIDEVSMVRCDTLDAIDTVLRHIRQKPSEAFGGVQVLFIGDLYQLPPVVKEDDWNILSEYYDSPFFFNSHALKDNPPVYIEFEKIYRQKDEKFIHVLNQVRNNKLDADGELILQSRYNHSFQTEDGDGFITLTTHNSKADIINDTELKRIPSEVVSFKASIEGDFPEKMFPADELLDLKIGAQVMFIRNDLEKIRRYYNGKIGAIVDFGDDKIMIQCKGEEKLIEVKREKWENIRYTIDKKTRSVDSEAVGTFTQYPLRLAWAITVHKSQGLTFEKAVIDAGDAFAAGQVYVALSRCTSLDGLVLKSHIKPGSLYIDRRVVSFCEANSQRGDDLMRELKAAAEIYSRSLLLQLFDFTILCEAAKEVVQYIATNTGSFTEGASEWCNQLSERLCNLESIGSRFRKQLAALFGNETTIGDSVIIRERINAAVNHFNGELHGIMEFIQQTPISTDSRMHAKEINGSLREIFSQVSLKRHLMTSSSDGINSVNLLNARNSFLTPSFTVNIYGASSEDQSEAIQHPLLYQQLRKLRDSICSQRDMPIYLVAGSTTLKEIAAYLPQTMEELQLINGFGPARVEKYGQQFLDVVRRYCNERDLPSQIHLKEANTSKTAKQLKVGKTNTKDESRRLLLEGNSIEQIATLRSLHPGTIEGHLAHFIEMGEIEIDRLLDRKTFHEIETIIGEIGTTSLNALKERLDPAITFGQIKLAIAGFKAKHPDIK